METTLADQAYKGLRLKLSRGELRVGQRIVNRTVAKELNISHTPLREAMNRLASEGVIEYVPGAGAYVRDISLAELLQLYDLREHIEPFAASLAARHVSDIELLQMKAVCDDWLRIARQIRERGTVATPEEMAQWNDNEERFHTLLLEASRNPWLIKISRNLRMLSVAFALQRHNPQLLGLREAAVTWREHVRIMRSLRRRDFAEAARVSAQHIRNGRAYIVSALGGGNR